MNHKEYTEAVEKKEYPKDPLCPLGSKFENAAGVIQNIIENCPVNSVAIIHSVKNSIRSNHYHKLGGHFLFCLYGKFEYYERNINEDSKDIKPLIIEKNMMVFSGPMKIHKTIFLEDTMLVSIGLNPRDKYNHENDLVRIEF